MSLFKDKTLMITGGTGSFGNAVLNRYLCSAGFSLALGSWFGVAVAGRGRRAVSACFTVVLFIQLLDELLYLCSECCYLLCQLCYLRRLRFNDL